MRTIPYVVEMWSPAGDTEKDGGTWVVAAAFLARSWAEDWVLERPMLGLRLTYNGRLVEPGAKRRVVSLAKAS